MPSGWAGWRCTSPPKLPVRRLFFRLGYAADPAKHWQADCEGVEVGDQRELLPAPASAFARQAALSSRAHITPTSFTNEYHWGDFRGDPTQLVERLYDAHLYYANWGSRRLVLRLPAGLLGAEDAAPFALDESLSVWTRSGHTLLDFSLSSEDGAEWDFESSFSLSALVGLRAELSAGDLRGLYLAWLAGLSLWAQTEDDEEYAPEAGPPVPAGLATLTGPQRALADLLDVDPDLLAVAARAGAPAPRAATVDRAALAAYITSLPAAEKDTLLLEAVLGTRSPARPGAPRPLQRHSPGRPAHHRRTPHRRPTPGCRPSAPRRTYARSGEGEGRCRTGAGSGGQPGAGDAPGPARAGRRAGMA
ncbi:hypothetical protein [Streptomyces virginiae]|uniref:hypothetical protein n=1 Tax=Streptomyces virginiae TaxID=1961 RepID=UPI0036BCF64D